MTSQERGGKERGGGERGEERRGVMWFLATWNQRFGEREFHWGKC